MVDQDDLGVKRKPLLRSPEPAMTSCWTMKPIPPEDDEPHHGEVDDPVPLVRDQVVRKEGVAAVVEGRDGMVDGVEEGRRRRKILGETDERGSGSRRPR